MNTFEQFFTETKHKRKVYKGYSKNGTIESTIRKQLGDTFTWFSSPKLITSVVDQTNRGRLFAEVHRTFVLGYCSIQGMPPKTKSAANDLGVYNINGIPSFIVARISGVDKQLWGYYTYLPFFVAPMTDDELHQTNLKSRSIVPNRLEDYIHFPFGLGGDDIHTTYGLKNMFKLINETPQTVKLINDFVQHANRGPEGYVDFFLNNPNLKYLDKNEAYRFTVSKALARAGYLNPKDITDKMLIDLL